jgi:gamma-D-glutamyl-L-lysine dipeptidyl-peptidase
MQKGKDFINYRHNSFGDSKRSIMNDAICCVPVSPLRAEASHRSEIVSQQVFGEQCRILERSKDWVRVRCNYDQYEGWCQPHHLHLPASAVTGSVSYIREWQALVSFNGQDMHLPYGSQIPGLRNGVADWGDVTISYSGIMHQPGNIRFDEAGIRELAMPFLNSSYLWGGKSIFGIDCSGFCQTVFRLAGIYLMRETGNPG